MPLPNQCLVRFRIFKHSISVFQQRGVLYCVYLHVVLKQLMHLLFASACIFNKSVILLLSQYCCFHWAFAASLRKIYTWLSAHPFHSCLLSVRGVFLWCIFGVGGSFLRNQFTFRVLLYNPEIGQESPVLFASVNKLLCTTKSVQSLTLLEAVPRYCRPQNTTLYLVFFSRYSLTLPSVNIQLL